MVGNKANQNHALRKHKCSLCPFSTNRIHDYKRHLFIHSSEKPFKCPECPFRAKATANVGTHMKNVHLLGSTPISSRPFPCPHTGCSYAAKQKSTLDHRSKIHSDEKSLFCSHPNCNYSTNNTSNLLHHTRTHTGDKPYVCPFESCSFATATAKVLVNHSRRHTKERPFKCPELNCEYSSTYNTALKLHGRNHHPKEGDERSLFTCPLCEYSTKHKQSLLAHIKRHTLEKFFKCDEPNCNYEAKTKQQIESHKLVHSDEKPFICSFDCCGFRCKSKSILSFHLKCHSDERRYKCELCPHRGKTREGVKRHLKAAHFDPGSDFRPFKCKEPQCDYAAKRKEHLAKHLLTHGGDKKYSCPFPLCDYRAVLASMVKLHQQRVHETEKKFKCDLCGFVTGDKTTLVRHVTTHTKEKPYICKGKTQGCEYRSATPSALIQHEKRCRQIQSKAAK